MAEAAKTMAIPALIKDTSKVTNAHAATIQRLK